MRGLTHRWTLVALAGDERESLVQRLIRRRSGGDERRRRILEQPAHADLHPAGSLPGADAAAQVLVRALRAGRRIAVYGDYDVDGITATALLWRFLTRLVPGSRVETLLPHRIEHGYGLNEESLRELAARGVQTVVSVDCGVTAVAESRIAEALGLELVVTDHHEIEAPAAIDGLRAAAVAHPSLPGESAPFPTICGALVAWKVACATARAWATSERVPAVLQNALVELLPLAALGTIADVMPLEDENRIVVALGLRGLESSPIHGLRALAAANARGPVDAESVAFRIAPMLNASGRLGHAAEALELLTTADERRSREIVRTLVALNDERKRLERACSATAIERAAALGLTGDDRRAIVLADPSWHEGVVGVACSRLVERFGRPTVLLQDRGGTVKGSARSVPGVHLLECLRAYAGPGVRRCGGHAMAAGLELDAAALPAFAEAFTAAVHERLAPGGFVPELLIDASTTLEAITLPFVQALSRLEPFGRGHPRPRVLLERVCLTASPVPLGDGTHATLYLRAASAPTGGASRTPRTQRAVWWGGQRHAPQLAPGVPMDVVVEPRLNRFRGVDEVDLQVIDARLRDDAAEVVTARARVPARP